MSEHQRADTRECTRRFSILPAGESGLAICVHLRRSPLVALCLCGLSIVSGVAVAQTQQTSTGAAPLDVRGALEASQVDAGTDVSFTLTVTNVSAESLRDVRVAHVGGADVEMKSATWCGGVSWRQLRQCTVAEILQPNQSITVYGALKTDKPVRSNIAAIVDWVQPPPDPSAPPRARRSATTIPAPAKGPLMSTATFPVSPLIVESAGLRWYGYVTGLLTSLAIPIGGGLFALWWKITEQARAQRQARRQEMIHELERLRDAKAEAWRLMLPVSHDYAIKYYAPLVEAASSLVHALGAVISAPADMNAADKTATVNAAFYSWVMLHVRRETLVKTGAYYFKNHTGELLAVGLYRAYSYAFVSKSDLTSRPKPTYEREAIRRLLLRVVADTEVDQTPDQFLTRLARDQKYGGDLRYLKTWFVERLAQTAGLSEGVGYLAAFSAILFFEMNRPYAPWFDDPAQATLSISPDTLKNLKNAVHLLSEWDEQIAPVKPKLEKYLSDATKVQQEGVS